MNKGDVLNEIQAYFDQAKQETALQPDDLTYEDVESFFHIKHAAAQSRMKRLVEQGLMTRHEIQVGPVRRVVFRWVN